MEMCYGIGFFRSAVENFFEYDKKYLECDGENRVSAGRNTLGEIIPRRKR